MEGHDEKILMPDISNNRNHHEQLFLSKAKFLSHAEQLALQITNIFQTHTCQASAVQQNNLLCL